MSLSPHLTPTILLSEHPLPILIRHFPRRDVRRSRLPQESRRKRRTVAWHHGRGGSSTAADVGVPSHVPLQGQRLGVIAAVRAFRPVGQLRGEFVAAALAVLGVDCHFRSLVREANKVLEVCWCWCWCRCQVMMAWGAVRDMTADELMDVSLANKRRF